MIRVGRFNTEKNKTRMTFIFLVWAIYIFAPNMANAGWFGLTKEAPKELTTKEKKIINEALCGCDVGSQTVYAYTPADAEYEKQIRPLMTEMNTSLRKTYNIHGSVQCRGWAAQSQIPRGRKTCISTYSNYGEDKALKIRAESLR